MQKYYDHFSSPKKIYNCVVHGYKAPYKCITATALGNAVRMVVDEQEYDVKEDVNQLRLIEY